jgi:hypothetical protein
VAYSPMGLDTHASDPRPSPGLPSRCVDGRILWQTHEDGAGYRLRTRDLRFTKSPLLPTELIRHTQGPISFRTQEVVPTSSHPRPSCSGAIAPPHSYGSIGYVPSCPACRERATPSRSNRCGRWFGKRYGRIYVHSINRVNIQNTHPDWPSLVRGCLQRDSNPQPEL